ncbi:MAG: DUF2617 family protein [Pseudonocardiaceae bacterium]
MRTLIATPFADSRAADLSLAHGLERLPALGTHQVELPGSVVELRVLGASHQVVAEIAGVTWSETVACLGDADAVLPGRHETSDGRLHARFSARCTEVTPAVLDGRVGALRRRCEGSPDALIGTFPGSPLAVTALLALPEPGGARWWSWHVYPRTGELVETASVVSAR